MRTFDKIDNSEYEERKHARSVARRAVREYAKDPSQASANAVRAAWERIRELDEVPSWRRRWGAWFERENRRTKGR